jgi:hypothetical protein
VNRNFLLLLLCAWVAFGFGWFKKKDKENVVKVKADPAAVLQNGYALLFKLMEDEKDVSKLLIIKKETPELHELIKTIAERAKLAHQNLEMLVKGNIHVNLKDDGLPAAESATRESISKIKAKELLGAKGSELELLLLLSQSEALTYGSNLAGVLAASETEPKRKDLMDRLAADLGELRGRVMKMLSQHYH